MKTNKYALSALALILIMSSCGHKESAGGQQEQESAGMAYQTFEITKSKPEVDVKLPGDLIPWQETAVYSKVKGFVKKVLADRGSLVTANQLLAVLEAPELVEHLNEEEARIEELSATHQASESTYKRILSSSRTKGAVSENELELAKAKMLADSANLEHAKAAYKVMREMVNYLDVRAPFDGEISMRGVSPGALVGPDDIKEEAPLFMIEDAHKLRLTVAVPEEYVAELHPGVEVFFTVSSYPDRQFKAILARQSNKMENNLRSMLTEFDVDNSDGFLKSGMFADVVIGLQREKPTYFVKNSALLNSTMGTFIQRIDDDETVEWVPVEVGNAAGNNVEVFGDLHEGDQVIVKASEEIRNGLKISTAAESMAKPVSLKE